MADDIKASKAAQGLAAEKDLDLSSVDGTGSDGQVTKSDVERAAEEAKAQEIQEQASQEPPEYYYVEWAPHIGQFSPVTDISVSGRTFIKGSKQPQNIVSKEDWENIYRDALGPPSMDFPEGEPLLQKGGKVS